MTRVFLAAVGLFALLGACTQRLACPAYQSSFIYDKETLRQKFSYFKEDSTPKMLTASKTKYLIAVPESYRKKYRKMQTIEMKPVYPKIPDSLKTQSDDNFSLAEVDEADSTGAKTPGDSTYAITRTKERFNLDQDLYMWYFRDLLVLPDVRAAMQKNAEKKEEATRVPKAEKKGFFEGIKGLFKKKPKSDSTSLNSPPKVGVNAPEPAKKKGGLFKKNKPTEPEKKKDPAKKKEDGDGF
jgi:hypothetical protein